MNGRHPQHLRRTGSNRALLRLRPICSKASGARHRPQRHLRGRLATRPSSLSGSMTETPAPGTSRTTSTPWPSFAGVHQQSCRPRLLRLGAPMVFLTAVRYGVDAAVAYHGGDTEKYLGEIDGLHAPMLMHLAEEDEFISNPAQAEIKMALAGKPNATVYSYPGQNHAFSRHGGAHYNAEAATLAHERTYAFLNRQLR